VDGLAAATGGRSEYIAAAEPQLAITAVVMRQLNRATRTCLTNVTLTWNGVVECLHSPVALPCMFANEVNRFYSIIRAPADFEGSICFQMKTLEGKLIKVCDLSYTVT
jgi:hypothetical protein